MKNPDEAIDRVLGGLREVEAPEGMERRVLAAMEERAAERSAAWGGWRLMGWVVACGVAAVVVAGVLIVRPAPRPVAIAGVRAPAVPMQVAGEQKQNTGVLHYVQDDVNFRGVRRVQKTQEVRRVEVVEVAKIEEYGFPAPPMPLTEEEKLLLHVARRSDAAELTPLNAEARERQEAEFDREFIEFFAVPQTVPDEKQTDPTESDKGETQ